MMSNVIQVVVLVALLFIGWKIVAYLLWRSPLEDLPGPPRKSWLLGDVPRFTCRDAWAFHDTLDSYGTVAKYYDLFGKPRLYVSDPKALQSIVLRDQDVYEEPVWLTSWYSMIFGLGLLSTAGAHHRKQRKLLNPVFSINHMRHMTPIFYNVAERLGDAIATEVKRHDDTVEKHNGQEKPKCEIDMLNWMGRTALELIGQAGLGYSFDPLLENIKNEFGDALKRLFPAMYSVIVASLFADKYVHLGPGSVRRFILDNFVPLRKVQELKKIVDTMDQQSRVIFREKKRALERGDEAVVHQIGEGKDILSIMLRANMLSTEAEKLDEEELIGQMSTLVLAATDTTSNGLSRILELLAAHQDVQHKLRVEILQAKEEVGDGRIPYDQLVDLPYLDAVCRETLRVYPPVTYVVREANKDMVLPLSRPVRTISGALIDQIAIPKNTGVSLSIRACNRNKDIWGPDAHEWKPERWLAPLPESVAEAKVPGVYSNLMTFVGGGRSCIGFKFSQLEMKVVLSVLLQRFNFSLSQKEIVWNLAAVAYPTVGKTDTRPSLPLCVQLVNSGS